MFSYTKKEVVMLAQELNVQKQTVERVLRLIDVLKFINTDEYLKEKLALKGGTAINLSFYNCTRLSVDKETFVLRLFYIIIFKYFYYILYIIILCSLRNKVVFCFI